MRYKLLFFVSVLLFSVMNLGAFVSYAADMSAGNDIIFNGGKGGSISEGKRDPIFNDNNSWLTLRAGDGGLRIISKDGSKELVLIDNFGGIYFNGDLFLNNEKLNPKLNNMVTKKSIDNLFILFICILGIVLMCLLLIIFKLQKELNVIKAKLLFEKDQR